MHNGRGRVDAGDVLEAIDLPEYEIWHSENQNPTITVTADDVDDFSQIFFGFDNNLSAGQYNVDRKRITKSWTIQFDPEVNILDAWEREGDILGISAANPNDGQEWQNLSINYSGNTATVTVVYFLFLYTYDLWWTTSWTMVPLSS